MIVYVHPVLITSSYHERASSLFRRPQKQDGDDKSQTAVGSEFQAMGPDTEKLHDPYCDSW